ncbi:MAG: C45 family peptidase [Solirubrobacteraceae bacterium]
MDWQNVVAVIVERYIPDPQVARTVLAEIKGDRRPLKPPRQDNRIAFRAIREVQPGAKLRHLYAQRWPAYREWYLRDGERARPTLDEASTALKTHMPELFPVWSRVVDAVGADELGARMLTMYDPPPLLSGCSQAALPGEPVLVRNYDYDVDLFDGVVTETQLTGRRVIGMSDQLWGLLDGVNETGLTVSFTFGGRRNIGRGFSIPLVIRYILESCKTVDEGIAVLRRIPLQAAYNVTLLDRRGRYATAWAAPGEPTEVTRRRATTNHQGGVAWPEHAQWTRSVERLNHLETLLEQSREGSTDLIDAMLESPMRTTRYDEGFGTLYTAVYRPGAGTVEYRWPGAVWRHSFETFREETFVVRTANGKATPAPA